MWDSDAAESIWVPVALAGRSGAAAASPGPPVVSFLSWKYRQQGWRLAVKPSPGRETTEVFGCIHSAAGYECWCGFAVEPFAHAKPPRPAAPTRGTYRSLHHGQRQLSRRRLRCVHWRRLTGAAALGSALRFWNWVGAGGLGWSKKHNRVEVAGKGLQFAPELIDLFWAYTPRSTASSRAFSGNTASIRVSSAPTGRDRASFTAARRTPGGRQRVGGREGWEACLAYRQMESRHSDALRPARRRLPHTAAACGLRQSHGAAPEPHRDRAARSE